MKALCLVREAPHYRRDACLAGLKAAGFEIVPEVDRPKHRPKPDDLVVVWNRYGAYESEALRFEAAGAAVIVMENGYLGHREDEFRKLFAANGEQLYAMALDHHNGAGRWYVGEPGRWREQGITVQPWRTDGEHILVLPQRGIGPPGVAMPAGWPERTVARLRTLTKRKVVLRPHPGNNATQRPLEADLEGAWCVVTWASGGALKALCAGVPVFNDFDRWIGNDAALPLTFETPIDARIPNTNDASREAMLDRLAWAQCDVAEISTGEPFRRLMAIYEAERAKAA